MWTSSAPTRKVVAVAISLRDAGLDVARVFTVPRPAAGWTRQPFREVAGYGRGRSGLVRQPATTATSRQLTPAPGRLSRALVSAICLVVWIATSLGSGEPLYVWPVWVAGPWGAMLLLGTVAGRATYGSRAIGH
jgi:hypothetical protein